MFDSSSEWCAISIRKIGNFPLDIRSRSFSVVYSLSADTPCVSIFRKGSYAVGYYPSRTSDGGESWLDGLRSSLLLY